ncbi:MAG: DUF4105 domain-containing protein [Pseudomonadota bacterium]
MKCLGSILAGAAAGACLFAVAAATKVPRHDRDWVEHLATTAEIAWSSDGGAVTIAPIRDWQYIPIDDGLAILEANRQSGTYRTEDLEAVWFVEEPHPGLPMMAHTFIVFDFGDAATGGGGMVGLTIEARKVDGERYNPLLGALNKYELIYVWAEPRDLISRRATLLEHELYAYRLALSSEQARSYFMALVQRTDDIYEAPRFYNTLRSNCTNELAKAAGLSWDPAFVFTGGAAEALFNRGLIAGETFETVRAAAELAPRVKGRNWRVETFNTRLRTLTPEQPTEP